MPTKCCSGIETTNSVWAGLFPFYLLCTIILNDRSTSISSCQLELGQGVALPINNRFLGAHSGHWCTWGSSGSGKGMQKCGLFVPRTCVIIRDEPDCHLQLIQVLKAKCRKSLYSRCGPGLEFQGRRREICFCHGCTCLPCTFNYLALLSISDSRPFQPPWPPACASVTQIM